MQDGEYRSWVGSVVELRLILFEREQFQRGNIIEEERALSRQLVAHLCALNNIVLRHFSELHSIQLASLVNTLGSQRNGVKVEEERSRARVQTSEIIAIRQLMDTWVDSLDMLAKAAV